jgi:hypothetical protein
MTQSVAQFFRFNFSLKIIYHFKLIKFEYFSYLLHFCITEMMFVE